MEYISQGILKAFALLISGDSETYSAIVATIQTSLLSISGSMFLGLPLGFVLGYCNFPGKKQLRSIVDTLLSMPTVIVGLLVYSFISYQGPLGSYQLLFTIPGIALAQLILIFPIVASFTASAIENTDIRLKTTLITLGASGRQIFFSTLHENRHAIITAIMAAYGRAISEVGISMMIGGNIKWHTRTITTAIALETNKGDFSLGIALGLVLLLFSFTVNYSIILLKRKGHAKPA